MMDNSDHNPVQSPENNPKIPGNMLISTANKSNIPSVNYTKRRKKPVHLVTFLGPITSLWIHAVFLIIAAWLVIRPPIKSDPGSDVTIELTSINQQELTRLIEIPFENDDPVLDFELTDPIVSEFDADVSAVEIEFSATNPVETLGGSGDDISAEEMGGAGGSGSTQFFGIESRGHRFLYIVDVSGSMRGMKLTRLKSELIKSIDALQEYTSFYVIAYNNHDIPMSKSDRWRRADADNKLSARAWIQDRGADGGTDPTSSFDRAFEFTPVPEVIYFMTDAQNLIGIAEYIANLNSSVRKTVINTIAFGSSGSEEIMRQIARESGGTYKYVPVSGGDN